MIYLAAFIASYLGVLLKAFQQKSVQFDMEKLVPPVSYGMALCESVTIGSYGKIAYDLLTNYSLQSVMSGVLLVIVIGTGAWMGTITAIRLHRRIRK